MSWSGGKRMPTLDERVALQNNPRYVQWQAITKSHCMCNSMVKLDFSEVIELMRPAIEAGCVEETEFRGWYRFTDKGWAIFSATT